jgi:hypothetical protein
LYYTKEDIAATLSRSNLDGTGEHEVARGVWGRCFEITADRVYFIRRAPSGEATLHSIKIATGKESQIGLLPTTPHGPSVWGLSVSPDGKYVIYSQIDRSAGDLMLVENFR